MMVPVSSPTRHSLMREGRRGRCERDAGPRRALGGGMALELTTLTMRLWPLVPGFKSSTLINKGFLFSIVVVLEVFAVVAIVKGQA
uniref:Uncharacterized protein MANES_13G142800 n=1 Tax=Rhizophora mucronata TaxID=61149 RepID=A0A2P2IZX5_RHIMU